MSDYRYETEERPVEPFHEQISPEMWADIADWEASRADYYESKLADCIKRRLPGDYADQVFNKSDALLQLSNLVKQYHNEVKFADNAESILCAVKNIIKDSCMIHHIDDVLSSRYKRG